MKKTFLLLFFFAGLLSQKTLAQQTPATTTPNPLEQAIAKPVRNPFFVYLSLGSRFSIGYDESLIVVFGKGYSLSVFTNRNERKPDNTPSGYAGNCIFGECGYPRETRKSTGLSFGKIIRTGNSKVRFHLKGGVGFGTIERPENFISSPPNNIFGWGPNYSYDLKKYSSVSLVLQPSVEFPFTRVIGLGLGLFADINKRWPLAGISANLYLGYLRERIKK